MGIWGGMQKSMFVMGTKFTSTLLRNGYLIFALGGTRRGTAPGLLRLMRLDHFRAEVGWNETGM